MDLKKKVVALSLVAAMTVGGFAATRAAGPFDNAQFATGVTFKVNGQVQHLDHPPIFYNNKNYLPVRAVSEILGVPISWDQATQSVLITDNGNGQPGGPGSVQMTQEKMNLFLKEIQEQQSKIQQLEKEKQSLETQLKNAQDKLKAKEEAKKQEQNSSQREERDIEDYLNRKYDRYTDKNKHDIDLVFDVYISRYDLEIDIEGRNKTDDDLLDELDKSEVKEELLKFVETVRDRAVGELSNATYKDIEDVTVTIKGYRNTYKYEGEVKRAMKYKG